MLMKPSVIALLVGRYGLQPARLLWLHRPFASPHLFHKEFKHGIKIAGQSYKWMRFAVTGNQVERSFEDTVYHIYIRFRPQDIDCVIYASWYIFQCVYYRYIPARLVTSPWAIHIWLPVTKKPFTYHSFDARGVPPKHQFNLSLIKLFGIRKLPLRVLLIYRIPRALYRPQVQFENRL